MRNTLILLCSAVAALSSAGCATVTKGTTEQITFNSEPPGAQAQTSIGLQCPSTPCTFEVSRKQEFIVTFSMPGYQSQQVSVQTKLGGSGAAGFAGNVLLGGVVGMGVDAATGSTMDHFPNPVFVTLQPDRPKNVAPPKPGKRNRTPARSPVEAEEPTS